MSETATVSDQQLLARYISDSADDAFAEIVRRHLNLVHSAALRQLRSPQLAEEVAQSVFTDLACHAAKIAGTGVAPVSSLTPWLYAVTRRTAIDVIRREARRQLREQIAIELNAMNTIEDTWTHIEPFLDEAVSALDESDRAAILLRYFENKSLREVGQILGTSDDAAQKRICRAVERLREFFAKRGVTVGTSGLVVVISAHAVQASPVGLAVTISTAALAGATTLTATTTATVTHAIVMTTLQKTLVAVALAALAGVGIYEARQASILRTQIQLLRQHPQESPLAELESLRQENQQLSKIKVDADELAQLRGERIELLRLRGEVGQLRRQAAEREQPQFASTPIGATLLKTPTTEAEFQMAQRQVSTALFRVGAALQQFMTNRPYGALVDTNGQPNPEIFANFPGLPLDNLEIQVGDIQSLGKVLDEKSRAIIAVTKTPIFFNGYYTRHYLLADGTVRGDFSYNSDRQNFTFEYPSDEELETIGQRWQEIGHLYKDIIAVRATLEPVTKAFLAANNGHGPNDLSLLEPYTTTTEQRSALQELLRLKQAQKTLDKQ